MEIGLKYCGGCNPNYNRSKIAKRAQEEYPEIRFEPYDASKNYDLVLVICGCQEECFTFTCTNSVHGTIFIHSENDYQHFHVFMETMKIV